MPSKYGGIPVEVGESRFGGVPVEEQAVAPKIAELIPKQGPPSMQDMFTRYLSGGYNPMQREAFEEIARRQFSGETMSVAAGQPFKEEAKPTTEPGLTGRTVGLMGEAAKNFPLSAVNILNDMGKALLHPLDTAQALGEIAFGGVQKLIPGEQENEQKFDAMSDFFAKRYGSLEALNETIAEDPAAVMADMSALFTGVGGLAKATGTISRSAPLAKAGEAIATAGAAVDPVNIAGTAIGKTLGGKVSEKMYAGASKMGTTKGIPERRAAVDKALKEELMPTEAGVKVLDQKKDVLYGQLEKVIDAATEAGDLIPRDKLFKNLRQALDKASAGPQSATVKKQIYNMMKQLRNEWPKNINPADVQAIKVSFQQAVKDSNWGKTTPGLTEANKQVARSARQILEDMYPEVKGINKELSEYKNLEKELERAASRIENNNPMGMTKMMTTGFGGAAGGIEGMVAGMGVGLILDPKVQAKLAIVLRRMRSQGVQKGAKPVIAREVLRTPERIEEQGDETP